MNAFIANREFDSRQLHETLLLQFYDHYLKGLKTDYLERPAVEYFVRGANEVRTAPNWPPAGVRYVTWHLDGAKSGSVTSLNDGTLTRERTSGEDHTSYARLDDGCRRLRAKQPAGPRAACSDLHDGAAARWRTGSKREIAFGWKSSMAIRSLHMLWTHYYAPSEVGTDVIFHSPEYPSALILPVMEGA